MIYSSLKLSKQLVRGLNSWISIWILCFFFKIIFGPFSQDSFTAQMPGLCISWLVAGGLLYTGGVPFFMLADYRPLCHWELWHRDWSTEQHVQQFAWILIARNTTASENHHAPISLKSHHLADGVEDVLDDPKNLWNPKLKLDLPSGNLTLLWKISFFHG